MLELTYTVTLEIDINI